ncbi:gpW family head-tail joining protein [Sphingomonas sp. NFR15]|uniref:gpW family head-tail joining protein n=1 Tax=Sphingomonas sp. NFR15 TaxID=1566282 RepID=UPI0008849FBF|nr:gpW family head-tail joining protein [Sphingomonas sp. NFR15]SDA15013.1 gpW protein [Sphingomonas sp. NFR15]
MPTREQLVADRAALVSARTSLLTGQQVKEYQRDGRRVVYATMTPDDIKGAIAEVDDQIEALDRAAGSGRPRFRALSVRFGR